MTAAPDAPVTPINAPAEPAPRRGSRARSELPLVYSCSGCSSAAQMTNWLAIQLDRLGSAEMSCIAGVGGDVPSLVRTATSGRPIIAIDGCRLECARHCLERHGVTPTVHHVLSDSGVKKRFGEDFDPAEASAVLDDLAATVDAAFTASS
jgi:uncharacterized metal-binding protein